jgi:hypothetical protein
MTNFWVTERHRGGLPARRHSAPNDADYERLGSPTEVMRTSRHICRFCAFAAKGTECSGSCSAATPPRCSSRPPSCSAAGTGDHHTGTACQCVKREVEHVKAVVPFRSRRVLLLRRRHAWRARSTPGCGGYRGPRRSFPSRARTCASRCITEPVVCSYRQMGAISGLSRCRSAVPVERSRVGWNASCVRRGR